MTCIVGCPPSDEMHLLRKELLLLQSELLFERHKCDLHATRNRRLVGKVFQANAVREELSAAVFLIIVYARDLITCYISAGCYVWQSKSIL